MNGIIKLFFIFTLIIQLIYTKCQSLPKFNVDIRETSVSGFSTGATFALQIQIAYSSIIKGAGIIAGFHYDCVRHVNNYFVCLRNNTPPIRQSINQTKEWSGHLIDDIRNMRNQRVYMLGETEDWRVGSQPMIQLYNYYVNEGQFIPKENVRFEIAPYSHIFPTDNYGYGNIPCNQTRVPFVGMCGYDGAGAILNQIYDDLKPRVEKNQRTGILIEFNQTEFISEPNSYGLDTTGYAYVPRACLEYQKCRLHIAFHGCSMSYFFMDLKFVENTGYDLWADSNNIIVVFPQTYFDENPHILISGNVFMNAQGCWDIFGIYDSLYDTNKGIIMNFIKNIIDRIVLN